MDNIQILIIIIIIIIISIIIINYYYNNIIIDNFNKNNKLIGINGEKGNDGKFGKNQSDCIPCKNPKNREEFPLFKFIKEKKYINDEEIILGNFTLQYEKYPDKDFIAANNLKEVIIEIPSGEKGLNGNYIIGNSGNKGDNSNNFMCNVKGDTGPSGLFGHKGPKGNNGRTIIDIIINDDYLDIKYSDNTNDIIYTNLKGDKGIDGINGKNGMDGLKGINGDVWFPTYNQDSGIITFNNPNTNEILTTDNLQCKCIDKQLPPSLSQICSGKMNYYNNVMRHREIKGLDKFLEEIKNIKKDTKRNMSDIDTLKDKKAEKKHDHPKKEESKNNKGGSTNTNNNKSKNNNNVSGPVNQGGGPTTGGGGCIIS